MKTRNRNKNIFLWALYNLANTPIYVAMGGLFLTQWIVLDNKLNDIWYGSVFTLASILLLITSPFLGAWSDKLGKRMPFIRWTTYIQIFVGLLLGIVATSSMSPVPRVVIVLILFFFLQYAYQASLIFYNSILKVLSTSKNLGKISGIADFSDNIGWLLGPAILMPFSLGVVTVFGEPGRAQVFLPAILILVLLGIPMLIWFKEPKIKATRQKLNFGQVYRSTIDGLRLLIKKDKNVTYFLLSFMLVSDALLTANLYFAVYMDQIFHISDFQKFTVLMMVQIIAVPFCYIFGILGDRFGLKKMLIIGCVILTLSALLLSATSSLIFVYILSALIGVGFGSFYTTSRALLVKISPPQKLGEYFGFYSTFQKFASIIGPVTYGGITLALKSYGTFKYRAAFFALSILMLIGTLILLKVKEERLKI
jgi:UMF1 family MFS transporter